MSKNKKLWFGAKKYGYGWTPITWEGWAILVVFTVFITWRSFKINPSSTGSIIQLVLESLVAVSILIWICVKKGEKARWRWGK